MDPYVHDILERNARAQRQRGAGHVRHACEVRAERAAVRRAQRLAMVHAVLGRLWSHAAGRRVPADAGGRT